MSERIPLLDPGSAPSPVRETLAAVKAKIGMVPNLYRVLGQSPAALTAYLSIGEALQSARLELPLRERIALAISQRNSCHYCLSAHSAIARKAGVSPDGIREARTGHATPGREEAAVGLAISLVEKRGWIDDSELASVRSKGLTDGEIVEVVAMVAQLTFSNYTNHLAHTPIDFLLAENLPVLP
jgi:uncharacterized peroxidase-related enzyme